MAFSLRDFGLMVTSNPYGAPFFERIVNRHIPVIVLADNIDEKLIRILNAFESSCCMIKPVDFDKFKTLVKEVLSGQVTFQEGYSIVCSLPNSGCRVPGVIAESFSIRKERIDYDVYRHDKADSIVFT